MKQIRKPRLTSTTIDVTEGCNLACDYCFTWSKHKPKKTTYEMATRVFDWWLPQTTTETNNQFGFWGGEPLLEWELIKRVVAYAEQKCIDIGHKPLQYGGTTNGLLYTPDKVEWGLEHNSLFLISLDGIQPVHDAHRKMPSGKGSWKIVDRNTREALKIAPQQKVRASLAADTIEYFFETIQYFVEDLGIHDIAFSPVFEGDWNEKVLETCAEQFELIIHYVIKKAKEGTPVTLKHLNDEVNMPDKRFPQNPCGAGNGYSSFSIDGFMYPCHRFNKHGMSTKDREKSPLIIARPKGDSFEYVNHEWREKFYNWKHNVPKHCNDCDIFTTSVCNGGCYALNWDLTGSLYKQPKSECDYNHVQHEAGMLYRKLAKEAGVVVEKTNWDYGRTTKDRQCTCYNLCYLEGTDDEIIHIDRHTDQTCICYNASYSGLKEPQCRPVWELDKEREATQRIIQAAKQMLKE